MLVQVVPTGGLHVVPFSYQTELVITIPLSSFSTKFHILKSISDPMLCATYTYSIMSMVTSSSKPNFYFPAKLVNNYIYNVIVDGT